MKKITVGHIYELVPVFSAIGKQEMDVEQAAQVAETLEVVSLHLAELEEKRRALLVQVFETDAEREAAFETFGKEQREIPEINFKSFPHLRLSPNDVLALKNAGLYVTNKDVSAPEN